MAQFNKERITLTEQNAQLIKSAQDLEEEKKFFDQNKKDFSTFKKISMDQIREVESGVEIREQKLEKDKENFVMEKVNLKNGISLFKFS